MCYNDEIMNKKEFLKLYLIQIFSMTFGSAIIGFILLFFYNQGASILVLAIGEAVLYLAAIGVYAYKKTFFTKKSFQQAIIMNFIIIGLLILANKVYFLWPIVFLRGLFVIYYWIPFNLLYFQLASTTKRATHSAWTVIVGPVIGSFVPILAGLVISNYSYKLLFVFGAVLNILMLLVINRIKEEKFNFDLKQSLASLKKIRAILFVEGMMHTVMFNLIPLMSLYFISKATSWGAFFSYLGLVGAVTVITFALISDKYKIRKGFLLPLSILLAISLMSLSFATDLWLWGLFVGVFCIIFNLFSPFSMTLVLDANKNNLQGWAGREIILNSGRFIIMLLAILCIVLNQAWLIFFITGLIFLSYPILVLKKKIYQ